MSSYVIENTGAATGLQRHGQRILTMIFWVLFALLLRPLITFFAWFLGGYLFLEAMPINVPPWESFSLPLSYLGVIFIIAVVFISWANYNLYRFGNKERRNGFPSGVLPADLAKFFQVEEDVVFDWQSSRRIVVSNDEGMIPLSYGKTSV